MQSWITLLMVIVVTSCSNDAAPDLPSQASGKCKKRNASLGIVNGEVSDDPGVKKLLIYNKKGEFIDRCTGVFISSSNLLTAAHCVLHPGLGGAAGKVVLEDTNESSEEMIPHDQYTLPKGFIGLLQNGLDVAKASNSQFDIAIVKFKPRKRQIFAIGAQGKEGDVVTMIGYGDTEAVTTKVRADYKGMTPAAREAYIRRVFTQKSGQTSISSLRPEGYFFLEYGQVGGRPFAAFGDSGGPLLNSNRQIIGVTSCGQPKNLIAGAQSDILTGEWRPVYTDLNSQMSRRFLQKYINSDDLIVESDEKSNADAVKRDPGC
jgi:hypothetical protein